MALPYLNDRELRMLTKPEIQRRLKESQVYYHSRLNKPDLIELYQRNMINAIPNMPRIKEENVARAIRNGNFTEFQTFVNQGLDPKMRLHDQTLFGFALRQHHPNRDIILAILNLPGAKVHFIHDLDTFERTKMPYLDHHAIANKLIELGLMAPRIETPLTPPVNLKPRIVLPFENIEDDTDTDDTDTDDEDTDMNSDDEDTGVYTDNDDVNDYEELQLRPIQTTYPRIPSPPRQNRIVPPEVPFGKLMPLPALLPINPKMLEPTKGMNIELPTLPTKVTFPL